MGASALRVVGATKQYSATGQQAPVLDGVSLEVSDGETVILLGPSGCGKSTLLRAIAGLEPLTAGHVELQHAGVPQKHSVGLVFQDPLLLPWLTVAENVTLGLRYRANRAAAASADVDALLAEFGLSDLADAMPTQLSGGQAQRVSLARTVITGPRLLLLDEPFAALDPRTRAGLQHWLRSITERHHLTVLMVTHDLDEALVVGDRVVLLSARPGRVVETWTIADNSGDMQALRGDILTRYDSDLSRTAPAPAVLAATPA